MTRTPATGPGAPRRRSRRTLAQSAANRAIAAAAHRPPVPPPTTDPPPSPSRVEPDAPDVAAAPVSAASAASHPAFAHASEAEMARILDFYQVRWEYEPHTFPIVWNLDGAVVESFSPDFWLPDLDLYLEMTTLRQKLVRKKNRKLRRVLELYPDLRVKLFYARTSGRSCSSSASSRWSMSCPERPARSSPSDRPGRRRRMMTRTIDLAADVGEVLLTEDEIQSKIAELGARISADYGDRRLTLVSVLKGSLPFMADLMRSISIPVRIDLMEVSSYGGTATESSGLVRILKDLSATIEGEEVLIVEDIIDTGLTLNYLLRYLRGKNPRSLRICTLLDKPARRLVDIPVDYVGFTIPDQFVVGYGLDYSEYYRNLRFVGVLRPEVYSGGD